MATRARGLTEVRLHDFSGGLNLRDAATELAPNESPNLNNVTLDERGGIVKRLGQSAWNATAADNLFTFGYESAVAELILWYSEADGKLYSDPGNGSLTLRRTWTAGDPVGIVDFAGKVYANHPVDGLYQSDDGQTWTLTTFSAGSCPNGSLLAVWQNRLWVADPSSTLLTFSAPGDAQSWGTEAGGGSNHIRDGNDYGIVCLYGGAGTDFQAQPALLVGKRAGGAGSLHRVTDASTADYVTIDQTIGPAGPLAITSRYGRHYILSTAGIFETDGFTGLAPIGEKLERLFRDDSLDYSLAAGFCAAPEGDSIRFSIARNGADANDLCLRYYPLFRAFTAGTDASACYVTYNASGETLIGASPSVTGQLYQLSVGGNDDGEDIESWFLTRVFEPLDGLECRVHHARVKMRSPDLGFQILPDFAETSDAFSLSAAQGDGFAWGSGIWGTGVWGSGDRPEDYAEEWPQQEGRAFQLRFDETSSLTSSVPALLESGTQQTAGGWAVYGVSLAVSQLGSI